MKGYMVTEEKRDSNGVLGFDILGLFEDKREVRKLLDLVIKENKYGLISEENAVINDKTTLRFQFGEEFVQYEMNEYSLVGEK